MFLVRLKSVVTCPKETVQQFLASCNHPSFILAINSKLIRSCSSEANMRSDNYNLCSHLVLLSVLCSPAKKKCLGKQKKKEG